MAKEHILVVDDELDVLHICNRILSADGYRVKTVNNGFEAVQLASTEEFDLLLTDIKMPGMDGLDVAEAARTVNPHIVCVTMTGYSTMDTAIEALRLGIEEFIIKPFTPQDLIAAVYRALEKERLRRESARLRALMPLFEASRTFVSTTDVASLANEVLATAVKELIADRALIVIYENAPTLIGEGEIKVAKSRTLPESELKPWLELASLTIRQERAVNLEDIKPGSATSLNAKILLSCPIHAKQGVLGALVLAQDTPSRKIGESDLEFLSVLCSQAGSAIENATLFEELRKAYEDLKQLDYMKSEFISIAAHELRTPLAILMGYAGIMEGMVPVDLKQYATIIVRNAGRLRALMDEMLNLDSLERGTSLVRLEAIDLVNTISEIIEDLHPLADNKKITLTYEPQSDSGKLVTDKEKFSMIAANLIGNAIKFTPEYGRITVRSSHKPTGILVQVSDTGIGIPRSEWEKIFERFYQIEDSLTREHEGIGLGLSIAKGMVELLGGRIWLESEVGVGSTFSFTLPLSPRSEQEAGK